MDINRFKGIYPAVITPFKENGDVDVKKLEAYIDYLCGKVDGLFVCGSYGSGPLMADEERMLVAETAVAVAKKRVPVIMQIGGTSTKSSVKLAQHAEKVGADAVAAITPFYYRHLSPCVKEYYRDIINSTSLPVIAYNNPKYTNFTITGDFLSELAEIGLQGIKDSSASITLFYDFIAKCNNGGFLFLIGSQTHLLPAMVGGAHGCVSGLSNAFPEFIKEIYNECVAGNYAKARELQLKANVLRTVTGDGIPVPFYHAVLPMLGVDIGLPRKPFLPLPACEVERIRKALEEAKMVMAQ